MTWGHFYVYVWNIRDSQGRKHHKGKQHNNHQNRGHDCGFSMNMEIVGVCGASITVSSIGGISSIIVRKMFGITIGGISDVFKCFFGVVGIFDIFIAFFNEYWNFLVSFDPVSFSVSLGASAASSSTGSGSSVLGASVKNVSGAFWCLGKI